MGASNRNLPGKIIGYGGLALVTLGCISGCHETEPRIPSCDATLIKVLSERYDSALSDTVDADRRCGNGQATACTKLISSLSAVWECVEAGNQTAARFLDKACEVGSGEACVTKAEIVAESWKDLPPSLSDPARVREALSRAFPEYRKGCELGHPTACSYVAWLTRDGIGVSPADPVAGIRALQKLCGAYQASPQRFRGGALPCHLLADSYQNDRGVPRDFSRARSLKRGLCAGSLACDDLFLVSWSAPLRCTLWLIEGTVLCMANGRAVTLLRRKRLAARAPLPQWRVIALMAAGTCAAIVVGVETTYFFWGSNLSSWAWLAVAVLPALMPVAVLFGRNTGAPPRSGQ